MNEKITDCRKCVFFQECGGTPQGNFWGCFSHCVNQCNPSTCPFVCPAKPIEFARRQLEVAGDHLGPIEKLEIPDRNHFPHYIPGIGTEGSRRDSKVESDFVALRLYDLFKLENDNNYRSKYSGADHLRSSFKLNRSTRLLVISNNFDRKLERFWRYNDRLNVIRNLIEFEISGIIVPNFSFFLEAPRTHSLYSRKRIEYVTRSFSDAGLPIIPHLQASVDYDKDWQYWRDFLLRFQEVEMVSAEFGTGWRKKYYSEKALDRMRTLVSEVGRPLHLVGLAAGNVLQELNTIFPRVTLVNHTPFIKAMHRQEIGPGMKWKKTPTQSGESVSKILDQNIRMYSELVAQNQNVEEIFEEEDLEQFPLLPWAENF